MSPRPRKNKHLPVNVYQNKGRYYFRPYLGRNNGKSLYGKEVYLCKDTAPNSEIWRRYEEVTQVGIPADSWEYLCLEYQNSDKFLTLAPRTQSDYKKYHNRIFSKPANKLIRFAALTPGAIRNYLDKRKKENAAIQGNREVAYISAVYSWAYARDMLPNGMKNPCHKVERNKETPRTLYVTDEAYDLVYKLATDYLKPIMELAYLCRLRPSEVLDLKRTDITEKGLFARRRKGSKDAVTTWTDRLLRAVNSAKSRKSQISGMYLLCDSKGQRLNEETVRTAWGRLMTKALKEGLTQRFTMHDLKAKGVSDFEGDKKKASGHKTDAMVHVYDRKVLEVEATK